MGYGYRLTHLYNWDGEAIMRIDLHCHTKKVKTGDAYTRNVTKDKFFQKVIEAEVKIIAITNHNQFDYMQYKEFKDVTEGYCDIECGGTPL